MSLLESIKTHEGFEGMPYKDHLGFDTIGYGTKLPLSKHEAELLLTYRLESMRNELDSYLSHLILPYEAWEILYEMAYQLGVGGVLKFKKMLTALEANDFKLAGREMLDSRWFTQTPNRAKELSDRMVKIR